MSGHRIIERLLCRKFVNALDVRQLGLDAPLQFRRDLFGRVESSNGESDAVGRFVGERRTAVSTEAARHCIRRLKFFKLAARPCEFRIAQRDKRRVEAAERLLTHAAMTNRSIAQCTLDTKAHRAALAATGMG